MTVLRRFPLLAAIIVLFSSAGWGQSSTSSLRGIVSDPQGAVVVGAKVNLSNPSTGFSQSTTTDNLGSYQFLQIPPGAYTMTVSMAGFATIKKRICSYW